VSQNSERQAAWRSRSNVRIGGFASAPQYAVAADGRFLLNVVASDAVVSSITLVLNWTGLLPR